MNIDELLKMVDERFLMYVNGQINIEELRSFVRDLVKQFAEELHTSVEEISQMLERIRLL